jgi:hypothetical protein
MGSSELCPMNKNAVARHDTADSGRRPGRTLSMVGQGGVVPYIATWTEERKPPVRIVTHAWGGIAFADESAGDRDSDGVLWARITAQPSHGRPQFAVIHSLRQRRAMRRLLCQVCAQPADRNQDGVLWLLPDYYRRHDGPENYDVTEPPICLACAPIAIRLCPALRNGYIAVRARTTPVCGVKGLVYRAGHPAPVLIREELVHRASPAIRWTLAEHLVRTLRECTFVDLDHQNPPESGS